MQAGAGVVAIGLGHAGGFESMPAGGEIDDALQVDAVVGGSHRVACAKVDLELAGPNSAVVASAGRPMWSQYSRTVSRKSSIAAVARMS